MPPSKPHSKTVDVLRQPARKPYNVVQPAVLEWMAAHPDQPWTIHQVREALPGYKPTTVGQCLANLKKLMPERFSRPAAGVYQYHSKPAAQAGPAAAVAGGKGSQPPVLLLVQVAAVPAGDGGTVLIMRDDDTGQTYTVRPYEWKV
jgi:hypothetical protein